MNIIDYKTISDALNAGQKIAGTYVLPMIFRIWWVFPIAWLIRIFSGEGEKVKRDMAGFGALLICLGIFGGSFIFSEWLDLTIYIISAAIIGLVGFAWSQRGHFI